MLKKKYKLIQPIIWYLFKWQDHSCLHNINHVTLSSSIDQTESNYLYRLYPNAATLVVSRKQRRQFPNSKMSLQPPSGYISSMQRQATSKARHNLPANDQTITVMKCYKEGLAVSTLICSHNYRARLSLCVMIKLLFHISSWTYSLTRHYPTAYHIKWNKSSNHTLNKIRENL